SSCVYSAKSFFLSSMAICSSSSNVNCQANLIRICHVCIHYKVSTEALEQYIMLGMCFGSSLGENVSAENLLKYNIFLSCLLQTNSIDGTVPEEVMFQSEVKKLQQEQFRPAEQVSISSQEMLQYIVLE
ncbi:unnamed protein product, partial [Brassica oleracea]